MDAVIITLPMPALLADYAHLHATFMANAPKHSPQKTEPVAGGRHCSSASKAHELVMRLLMGQASAWWHTTSSSRVTMAEPTVCIIKVDIVHADVQECKVTAW